jgi:hypothetical protein
MYKLVASVCVSWTLALSPAIGGETRVQYVDGYFCRDLYTLEALDEYLSYTEHKLFAVRMTGGVTPTVRERIQMFNDKLDPGKAECPHIQEYAELRPIGLYKSPWREEGYTAIVVEARLPVPNLEPEKWSIFVGLKENTEFYCSTLISEENEDYSYAVMENPNCRIHGL